jgi:hypothetical protein
MKVLTMMASIFIPLSFMTGLYGMNFENMPELRIRWSYPALLAVMLLTALGILLYVRAHALPCGQHAPRSAPPAALRLRFRYSRTRVRSVPALACVVHQRRMACPDPKRIRRQIACRPPQASLGQSVEEAGA